MINILGDSAIFVFGSNKSGVHGAGAALYAKRYKGAKERTGEGLTGQAYALPTKGFNIERLALSEVRKSVDRFIDFANKHKNLRFQVTQVGCGLGGFTKYQIAPLFISAPNNCWFDEGWKEIFDPYDIEKEILYWGKF